MYIAHLDPDNPDNDEGVCPDCEGVVVKSGKHESECLDCGKIFEPDHDPE